MSFRKTKSEVIKIASKMNSPVVKSRGNSVYIEDGSTRCEIYRASNMEESGLISAMNQRNKYSKWIDGGKK